MHNSGMTFGQTPSLWLEDEKQNNREISKKTVTVIISIVVLFLLF